MDDSRAGTRVRVGEVGLDLAHALAEQGALRTAEQALSRPHFGVVFSKSF